MPYKIVKVTGGYKVGLATGGKMSNNKKYLSDKPLTKVQAEKQKKLLKLQKLKKNLVVVLVL